MKVYLTQNAFVSMSSGHDGSIFNLYSNIRICKMLDHFSISEGAQFLLIQAREQKTGEDTRAGAVCNVICDLVCVDVATEQR